MSAKQIPYPENEKERLLALDSYDILDSLPEKEYNAIARLASYICKVPIALITLMDKNRQWYKAKVGMDINEVPRVDSFCNYTMVSDTILQVPDTFQDNRFKDHKHVENEPHVRFYAGAPLIDTDGYVLGTLCVVDLVPRELSDEQLDALHTLADEVMSHLNLRKQNILLEQSLIKSQEFGNLFNASREIHCILDAQLNIELINQSVTDILGYNADEITGKPIWSFFIHTSHNDAVKELRKLLSESNRSFEKETPVVTAGGETKWISWFVTNKNGKWYASGRDITDQKKVLAELEQLSLVASKINNGVVISNANDETVWTNDAFEHITGYSFDEVEGRSIRDVLKGRPVENAVRNLDEAIADKRSYSVHLHLNRKDGEEIWISVINTVIHNDKGEPDKFIRIITDITKRKKIEQDLEILSFAARKSPTGIMIRDNQGAVLWMNEALEHITGYCLNDLQYKPLGRTLMGPKSDVSVFEAALKAVQEKRGYDVEIEIHRKDGTPVWTHISNSPLLNEEGGVERQIGTMMDITARKTAEEELKLLSLVASNTTGGIVINGSDGKVEWINKAFEKITGYTIDDVEGRHLGDVLKGELTDVSIIEKSRELSRNKQSFEVDLLIYRKDGQPLWISVINSVILDRQGRVDKYIEVIIDITAKKKVEIELTAAKEEALQLSRAKDMFISVMSHEIRTPLNAVIGMSRLLVDDNPSDGQRENLNILKFSAENLMRLINDLLDFTKIETGNVELEKAPLDLRQMVKSVAASMQFIANGKNIYLKDIVDEAIPGLVVGDSARLTQIMLNLVSNSVKFTQTGGVTIELKVVEATTRDVRIRFSVSDTGIGIPADKINTIFESFKQAEADTSRKYGGTGLGLAITKRLIELHDSRINVESVYGEGSTFWFTVTFNRVDGHAPDADNNNIVETGLKIHALVVDDNQINRLLINKVLTKWGATADFAENGIQAVQRVEDNQNYDVVLMDIHMPEMGGLEATQVIRSKGGPYYQQLPIIALTASMLTNQMNEITEAGMNDYVLKPFDPKALFDKLSKYQKG